MRVIAGTAKSIQLITLDGNDTRPTTDRTKETLFNMIQYDLGDCVFLDLFGGSGAIGIEALSRGAKEAYFVENNGKAITCIKKNLEKTKLKDRAKVIKGDALSSIEELDSLDKSFDIIFIDPPFNRGYEKDVLARISKSNIIHEKSIIIVEAALNTNFDYLDDISLKVDRQKEYKTSKHVFISKS